MKKTNKELKTVENSALIGAIIEWYEFFLYGVVSGLYSARSIP